MKIVEFNIEGMKCDGCVNRVRNVLSKVKGVKSYEVSLENKVLKLEVVKDTALDEAVERIENLGFLVSRK